MKKIILKTKDEVKIVGDYYFAEGFEKAAILLHMMPSDRKSWAKFAEKLLKKNIQSLAVDLRGHGDSVNKNGEILDYKKFSDKEHQESILDVEAAVEFFVKKGISLEKTSIVGASIGANLALKYQSSHSEIQKTVLLSPGLDYRGITTQDAIDNLSDRQSIFIAASEEDEYSAESAKKLFNAAKNKSVLKILKNAGHGTSMLKNEEFEDEVIAWLTS